MILENSITLLMKTEKLLKFKKILNKIPQNY